MVIVLVLYGCETWLLTLTEERRLRVFENRVLRRIFVPKWDELTGEWRKMHNEEPTNLCSSPNIFWVTKSRRMRWVGYVSHMGESKGIYRVLVEKPEGRTPLGRPRCRSEGNIKMYHKEVGSGGMDWIDLTQDRDR
jgi:hypothetical protein